MRAEYQVDLRRTYVTTQCQHQRVVEQRPARVEHGGMVAIADEELVGLDAVVAAHQIIEGDAAMPVGIEQHESHSFSSASVVEWAQDRKDAQWSY